MTILTGATVGTMLGFGIVLTTLSITSRWPNLSERVKQGQPLPAKGAGASIVNTVTRVLTRIAEGIGSTNTSVERRLLLVGAPGTLSLFRLQQVVVSLLSLILGAAGGTLLAVRGNRNIAVVVTVLMVVSALGGATVWDQVLSWRAQVRQRRINAEVPDFSELLALSISAGESIYASLARVSELGSSDLADEIRQTVAELQLGVPSSTALSELARRNESPALDRLCQTLLTAIERGAPLAVVLHDQARDIRETSRQQLMEEGGKREIFMLFPVVFLILPITILFALYPGLVALRIGM